MYIKSVIIDGFKSYGRRTEIHGFDKEFTAITGLNGTGKSNILDAICFVLGIINLGQVRAASLNDLVYKGGQAGITKATVTLIFDNADPNQCPLGYEKCREISVTRQIVVGGKNKYLINGKLVQNKKTSDFFCSVQLNVNNPNFLIMQGRITKVLNMKPQEILSMIEEAAGTSMYETKRDATTKLIEKKDAKVRETNTLLQEEVEPKLEKLRKERNTYLEFQKICRDIEYLTRIHISYRYLKQKEALTATQQAIERISNRMEICRKTVGDNENERLKIEQELKHVQQKIDNDSGGQLTEIEEDLSTKIKMEAKISGKLKTTQGTIDQEQKKIKALELSIKDDEKTLLQKEMQKQKVEEMFHSLKMKDEEDSQTYENAKKRVEAVTLGLSTNEEGQILSLQDQLIDAKKQLCEKETFFKTSEMELQHTQMLLKEKKCNIQTRDAAFIKDREMEKLLENDILEVKRKMDENDLGIGCYEKLQQRKNFLQQEIRQINHQLDLKNAYRYDLQYSDPDENFDRTKMKGMVGKLFNVPNEENYVSLIITAGNNLYSYVSDDDVASKKILQKGKLQQRATIIPINKISSHQIEYSTLDFAKKLVGKQNVETAISLIEYDCFFDPVMKFVFGRTLVCRDLNIAKQVTYHHNINCRSVTLEGDLVDPEGTLSGGSRPKGGNILKELADIKNLEANKNIYYIELQDIEEQLKSLNDIARFHNENKNYLELRQHELNACKQRLAQTTYRRHEEEIRGLETRINALESDLRTTIESKKMIAAKVRNIEEKLLNSKEYREREIQSTMDAMKKAKQKADEARNGCKTYEQEYETFQLEIDELRRGIGLITKQRDELVKDLTKITFDVEHLRSNHADIVRQISALKMKIKVQKEHINSHNKELQLLANRKDKLEKQNQELTLEIKKKENEIYKMRTDSREYLAKIKRLKEKYAWINDDFECFGIKNTRYDYSKENPIEAGQKLNLMCELKDRMERNINLKAMMLLDREEEQYQKTIRRKKIVEQDKEKIKHIICKMDEKKREKVDKAWKEVNDNFSAIFSSLLQGAQARLNPIKQGSLLIGLEIKVGFNGVWKESLGELSGGQRSLVALSLVLAMLKFSPAPLYILDEVDAALDMAHTQNIGNMLKTHFTSSQFIIVSLKDGMFNNANVLFRTKFEEGVSVITRTVNAKLFKQKKKIDIT